MRLNLNIQYGDQNVTINASVGDGSATIKWLGKEEAVLSKQQFNFKFENAYMAHHQYFIS